jgi:hypothetical protein
MKEELIYMGKLAANVYQDAVVNPRTFEALLISESGENVLISATFYKPILTFI